MNKKNPLIEITLWIVVLIFLSAGGFQDCGFHFQEKQKAAVMSLLHAWKVTSPGALLNKFWFWFSRLYLHYVWMECKVKPSTPESYLALT